MTATATDHAATYSLIPIADLQESKTNPRRVFDPDAMKELVASVRDHGVLQPVLVRAVRDGFEVVAGARRYRAAKAAGLSQLPCIVRELQDKQVLEIQFVENLQRSDLHPLDEGIGYLQLHEVHGYRVEDLAGKLNKSKAYVYGRMQLAKLPTKAQTLFFEGSIDVSHAQLVARIPVPELADRAAAEIAKGWSGEKPMTFRSAAEHVRRNYQCDLRSAPFPQGDKSLVPEAGACGPCPKRTGNQKGLFDQVEGGGANVCTDPKCFVAKQRAWFQVQKAEVLEKGGEVLEGKKADEVRYSSTFVRPDDHDYSDPKHRTYKQLTKGQELKPVLVAGRDGAAPELRWRRADVTKAMKANGHKRTSAAKGAGHNSSASSERWREKRRLQELAGERVLPAIAAAAEKLDVCAVLRLLIVDAADLGRGDPVEKRRGIDLRLERHRRGDRELWPRFVSKETRAALEAMTVYQLQGLLLELMASEFPDRFCNELGVDVKKAAAEVKAEEKAKAKQAAAAAKAAKSVKPGPKSPVERAAAAIAAKDKAAKSKKKRKGKEKPTLAGVAKCRECGCTDARACDGGCSWVEPDLCSACVDKGGSTA